MVVHGHCLGQSVGIGRKLDEELRVLDDVLHALDNALEADSATHHMLLEAKEQSNATLDRIRCHDFRNYIARAHKEEARSGRLLAWLISPETRRALITQL
ncbi:hypothetical protein NDU88_005220 [Pleurodeles waltl]|uniref:Uncharacterized protein n=1 Tax=Pleurodeles waltl TaxID=8319 RepID=A0AAV7TTP3_PLEWA|nr:hypothetical protein NDU88_005220 [Pleurodeles waltl]